MKSGRNPHPTHAHHFVFVLSFRQGSNSCTAVTTLTIVSSYEKVPATCIFHAINRSTSDPAERESGTSNFSFASGRIVSRDIYERYSLPGLITSRSGME